ncbi:MAG: phosphohydrolase [Spirochaetota bacterium]|nr:phosphohydrolase [Spirochaetota bacterium]
MKSAKEKQLEASIQELLGGKASELFALLCDDEEVRALQDYANMVSLNRMHYNDHGAVHMRTAARNALVIANILHTANIEFNLEREGPYTYTDAQMALVLSAMLHDIGMTVGREAHERIGTMLALPIIDRLLALMYPGEMLRRIAIRSVSLECIAGHMASRRVHTLEAGTILIADGCDMKKGRARIPMILNHEPKPGDIHQYSAAAIEDLLLEPGTRCPLKITVLMSSSVGFFQVEEVLFPKIESSTVKPYIELYAGKPGEELRCYL